MPDKKVSELTAATAAAFDNEVPINESGTSKKLTVGQLVEFIYPVGSIYISVVSTNPGTLFGVGTWVAFATGRTLIGIDAGNTDFDTVEETGGNLTITPTGTVSQPTFTGDALAGHQHGIGTYANSSDGAGTPTGTIAWPVGVPTAANESAHTHSVTSNVSVSDHASHTHTYTEVVNHTHTITITDPGHRHDQGIRNTGTAGTAGVQGASTANNATITNAVPTATTGITASSANPAGGVATGTTAGPNATLTHSVTNNAVTSGTGSAHTHTISWPVGVPTFTGDALSTHTHTMSGKSESVSAGIPSGIVSQPTFTGNAASNVPPYIIVYMWKRTA